MSCPVTFKINISNIRATGIVKSGKEGDDKNQNETKIYMKFNFDNGHTIVQTEASQNKKSDQEIIWKKTKNGGFVYRTKYGDQLDKKFLKIECWKHNLLFGDKQYADAEIDFYELATGPKNVNLVLRSKDGNPYGHILFDLSMEHIAESMSINLNKLCATMSSAMELEKGSHVRVFYSQAAHQTIKSKSHANACGKNESIEWQDLPLLHVSGVSCQQLAQEYLILQIFNSNQKVVCESHLSLFELFCMDYNTTISFDKNLLSKVGQQVCGKISGNLVFRKGPMYCQMPFGTLIENGVLAEQQGNDKANANDSPLCKLFPSAPIPKSLKEPIPSQQDMLPSSSTDSACSGKLNSVHAPMVIESKEQEEESLFESDQVKSLIASLQKEHEVQLAGLKQSFEQKRQKQKDRLETRLKQRKAELESQKHLEQPVPTSGQDLKNADNKSCSRFKEILTKFEDQLFGKLSNKPPNRYKVSSELVAVPLPTGWQERWTEQGERYFCFKLPNTSKHFTTWLDPRIVPSDWEMTVDVAGKFVFEHVPTQTKTFQDPRGLFSPWVAFVDIETKKLMFSRDNMVTNLDPRGLPPGIEAKLDDSGALMFLNKETGDIQLEDPRLLDNVSKEATDLWLKMELLDWTDEKQEEIRNQQLQNLNHLMGSVEKEFEEWEKSQQEIVDQVFESFQLALLEGASEEGTYKDGDDDDDDEKQMLCARLSNKIKVIQSGWEDEKRKLQLEFSQARADLLR